MKNKVIAVSTVIFGLYGSSAIGAGTDATNNTGTTGSGLGSSRGTGVMRGSDNTKVNQRDRAANAVTADQQTNSSSDIDITRRIRQEIMKDNSFSTYAQNVKIIAVNGKVTLKGPVRSQEEQSSILKYAGQVAGATNVTNEMSVETDKK